MQSGKSTNSCVLVKIQQGYYEGSECARIRSDSHECRLSPMVVEIDSKSFGHHIMDETHWLMSIALISIETFVISSGQKDRIVAVLF